MATPYSTLCLLPTASSSEIRSIYKRLVLATHPDKGGDPSKFRLMQVAYEIISDPMTRHSWDLGTNPAYKTFVQACANEHIEVAPRCRPAKASGGLFGSGVNPTNPFAWQPYGSDPFSDLDSADEDASVGQRPTNNVVPSSHKFAKGSSWEPESKGGSTGKAKAEKKAGKKGRKEEARAAKKAGKGDGCFQAESTEP